MDKLNGIRRKIQHVANFCNQNRLLIVVLLAALLFDTISTIYFMGIDGIDSEFHPVVRFSALFFGPIVGTFLTAFMYKAVVSVVLAAYLERFRNFILLAPAITSTIAGFINFFGITHWFYA